MKKIKSIIIVFMIMLTSVLMLSSCKEPEPEQHIHSYEWQTTVNPTCENKGTQKGVCSCGYTETKEIPAKGHYFVAGICTDCGKKQ